VWARIVLEKMARGPLPTEIAIEVQSLRIGGVCIVGMPGEVFAEIGFQIEESIAGPSLVLGYSNGNVGYLCTQASYEGGGYEPAFSWMLYVHPPSSSQATSTASCEPAARSRRACGRGKENPSPGVHSRLDVVACRANWRCEAGGVSTLRSITRSRRPSSTGTKPTPAQCPVDPRDED
jgi:hypothetical protein